MAESDRAAADLLKEAAARSTRADGVPARSTRADDAASSMRKDDDGAPSQREGDDAVRWTRGDAVRALQAGSGARTLLGVLRLLEAASPDRARLGYGTRSEEEPVRIDQRLLLGFATAEVDDVREGPFRAVVLQSALGLTGPNGVLPYAWTEHAHDLVASAQPSERDASFIAWLGVVQRRQLSLFYRAWADYDGCVAVDRDEGSHPLKVRLQAIAGRPLDVDTPDSSVHPHARLAFAATFARRVRSPLPLGRMLEALLRVPVTVQEFVPCWLRVDERQVTRLGTGYNTLGAGAVAGDRVWDCASTFRVVAGPLTLAKFWSFIPGGAAWTQAMELVRAYVGTDLQWELQPRLEAPDVPACTLGSESVRLGWSTWLGMRPSAEAAGDLVMPMPAI